MPRIARTAPTRLFSEMSMETRAHNERGDCSVKAVALAMNVPYATAKEALAKHGRKDRKGAHTWTIRKAITDLGGTIREWDRAEYRAVIASYPKAHQILKAITTHHPRRFPKVWSRFADKTLVVYTKGHVAVIKGGELHDWTVNSARPITSIWEVTGMWVAPVATPDAGLTAETYAILRNCDVLNPGSYTETCGAKAGVTDHFVRCIPFKFGADLANSAMTDRLRTEICNRVLANLKANGMGEGCVVSNNPDFGGDYVRVELKSRAHQLICHLKS